MRRPPGRYCWFTLAVPGLGLTRRVDEGGVDNAAVAQRRPLLAQMTIDRLQEPRNQKLAEVYGRISFGGLPRVCDILANWHSEVISYIASSSAGSLRANQF